MKQWSLRTIIIAGFAILIGILFKQVYPLVDISVSLAVIFVAAGVVITTLAEKIYILVKTNKSINHKREGQK